MYLCPISPRDSQKGQVLLIVVLVMIISLTVGLSLISRSVTNLRTSTEEAESQKALSAAEAGIEQALKSGTETEVGSSLDFGKTTYGTSITQVEGTSFFINGENAVPQDDGADVWLSEYKEDDTIFDTPLVSQTPPTVTLYWGEPGENVCNGSAPALEISVISGSKATPVLQRYTFDPCTTRSDDNNFADALPAGGPIDIAGKNITFNWKTPPLSVTNGLIMRIVPVYYDGKIAVTSTASLPLQGKLISSTGEAGKTQRKINVFQGYPRIPSELFPYAIFSPSL